MYASHLARMCVCALLCMHKHAIIRVYASSCLHVRVCVLLFVYVIMFSSVSLDHCVRMCVCVLSFMRISMHLHVCTHHLVCMCVCALFFRVCFISYVCGFVRATGHCSRNLVCMCLGTLLFVSIYMNALTHVSCGRTTIHTCNICTHQYRKEIRHGRTHSKVARNIIHT